MMRRDQALASLRIETACNVAVYLHVVDQALASLWIETLSIRGI